MSYTLLLCNGRETLHLAPISMFTTAAVAAAAVHLPSTERQQMIFAFVFAANSVDYRTHNMVHVHA